MKVLASIILLILSVTVLKGQPYYALGESRQSVIYNMTGDQHWILSKASRSELTYVNDTSGVAFTYRFVKDVPAGLNRTCTEIVIEFNDQDALQAYIDDRLSNCRFRVNPDMESYTLNTDLYDLTIHVYTIGVKTLIVKY